MRQFPLGSFYLLKSNSIFIVLVRITSSFNCGLPLQLCELKKRGTWSAQTVSKEDILSIQYIGIPIGKYTRGNSFSHSLLKPAREPSRRCGHQEILFGAVSSAKHSTSKKRLPNWVSSSKGGVIDHVNIKGCGFPRVAEVRILPLWLRSWHAGMPCYTDLWFGWCLFF